jgi:Transposase, Mutator family
MASVKVNQEPSEAAAPASYLKSTNLLEHLNEEIKRRTNVVRIFRSAPSCLRLIRALAVGMHENRLEAHRYLNMPVPAGHRFDVPAPTRDVWSRPRFPGRIRSRPLPGEATVFLGNSVMDDELEVWPTRRLGHPRQIASRSCQRQARGR